MMNPITSVKTCWSILKTLLNNKKIPCIPTDLKKKAELLLTPSLLNKVL